MNPVKHIKYKGHFISGSKGFYWSYAMGQDISGKTIAEVKRKINRLEYGRNPGAAYHKEAMIKAEQHASLVHKSQPRGSQSESFFRGQAHSHGESLHDSITKGMPNPSRRKSMKVLGIPVTLLVIAGVLGWLIYKNR